MDLQVSPITLMLSFSLVMVGVYISYKEKLGTAKDILYSIARAVVQLIAVGYVLTYLFNVNNTIVTLVMVAVIVFNASWNAHKRSSSIPNSLKISLIAISSSAILTLSILVLSGVRQIYSFTDRSDHRHDSRECDDDHRLVLPQPEFLVPRSAPADSGKTFTGSDSESSFAHHLEGNNQIRHAAILGFRQNGGYRFLAGHDVGSDVCRYGTDDGHHVSDHGDFHAGGGDKHLLLHRFFPGIP